MQTNYNVREMHSILNKNNKNYYKNEEYNNIKAKFES